MGESQDQIALDVTKILEGDALYALERIPDASVQLCLTSPPYNIGKSYEKDAFGSFSEYRTWMETVLRSVIAKLKPEGSLCLQVGNHVENGRVTPLDYVFVPMLLELGLILRNRIIWTFNFGLHAQHRLSGRYETLLWFTKSDDYIFNLDAIRVEQIYPGKRHSASKGEKAGKPSGNPSGKNPSDFWKFDPQAAFFGEGVWEIPNVKAHHPEKTTHPCQFPNELADRCVLAFSNTGDVVLDPFVGTGTTAICAQARGRIGIGVEIQSAYVVEANERLAMLAEGRLPIRHSGRPPLSPKKSSKVAKRPDEWSSDGAEIGGTENGSLTQAEEEKEGEEKSAGQRFNEAEGQGASLC